MKAELLRDDITGFALCDEGWAFVLVDTRTGEQVECFERRDQALDAYEKARAGVRRDMKRGLG